MVACLDLDSRANDEAALTPSPSEFPTQSFCWEIEKDLKVLKLPESASQMPSQSRLSSFLHPSGVKRVMLSYSGIEFILMSGLDWMWNQSNPRNDFLNPTTTPFEYAVDSSWCTSSSEVTEACNASDSLGSGLITVMGLVVDSDSLWIMLNSFCVPKTVCWTSLRSSLATSENFVLVFATWEIRLAMAVLRINGGFVINHTQTFEQCPKKQFI